MSRFSRQKEKYRIRSELSKDHYDEGSAARTRPFSFDEIMLSRKNKKLSGDVKEEAEEVENKSRKGIVEDVSDRFEPDKGYRYNKDYLPGIVKHVAEDIVKGSSRKRESKTSINEDSSIKGKHKASRELEIKSKAKLGKDMSSQAKDGMIDKWGRGRRKNDERSSNNSEIVKDTYADHNRGKFERDSKREHRNGDNENYRDRNAMKKHDFRKRHNSEYSEAKERKESSKSHYEESRAKRRRSRSREREKHTDQRSRSTSPKAHKRTTYHGREHGELSLHPLKDKPGRKHSDIDRSGIPSNGSSSHYHRHDGSKSGLGGYSPRKRRSEIAVKTPSPTARSPEKKSAGWDLPPVGKDKPFSVSVVSPLPSSNPTVLLHVPELTSAVPVNISTVNSLSGFSANALPLRKNAFIDSIQLTQATRPSRRLCVENLPASASEKEVMECLNTFLLSSGITHIQGTQPCISCIIHKEKDQALVEFLTPEDASVALTFDGTSFSGSVLKIRRPKDFIEVATGIPEKSTAAVDAISDIVKDSPHKIFIGGISRVLSSEMIMEIASAFGALKAYHFQRNDDLDNSCAFLEYIDQLVTSKACAGLNGMKVGGQVLTVVQATPDASIVVNKGNSPSYRIPEHAKPLLEKPTQVLKLKNLFNPESLLLLSDAEMEEVLEDVRLECARFGTVKSVNIVKLCNSEAGKATDHRESAGPCQVLGSDDMNMKMENLGEVTSCDTEENSKVEVLSNIGDLRQCKNAEYFDLKADTSAGVCVKDKPSESNQIDGNVAAEDSTSDVIVQDFYNQMNSKNADVIQSKDFGTENNLTAEKESCSRKDIQEAVGGPDGAVGMNSDVEGAGFVQLKDFATENKLSAEKDSCSGEDIQEAVGGPDIAVGMNSDGEGAGFVQSKDFGTENKLSAEKDSCSGEDNVNLQMTVGGDNGVGKNSDGIEKIDNKEQVCNLEQIFEPGCVFIEYGRTEASCIAAHCLHGRLYDDRFISVTMVAFGIIFFQVFRSLSLSFYLHKGVVWLEDSKRKRKGKGKLLERKESFLSSVW